MVTPWVLTLLAVGLLAVMAATAVVTWLAASARGDRWRRRAEHAEEALQRLRAQRRQRRGPLVVPPGLFDEVDRAERAAADTVLLGAVTPYAEHLLRELGRPR